MTQNDKGQFDYIPVDPNEPYDLYKLTDPRDGLIRYIGISTDVIERFKQHLKCKGSNKRKSAWFQELEVLGLQPILEIIEHGVPGKKLAKVHERYWINYYGEQGHPLLNVQSAWEVRAVS